MTGSPSLAPAALEAALGLESQDRFGIQVGGWQCVSCLRTYKIRRSETRAFVCPEDRSALVPASIASDEDAVRRYVGVVFGRGWPL